MKIPVDPAVVCLQGDIRDRAAVLHAMSGATRVIHLASLVSIQAERERLFDINVEGTRTITEAALELGVTRMVYTSSCAAVTFEGTGICDETTLQRPRRFLTAYGESKARSEEVVDEAAGKGLETNIVYPTRVFGRGSLSDSNSPTRVISLYSRGLLPFIPGDGNMYASWVLVDDVAGGIIAALEQGRAGERYLLGGENATLHQVYAMVDEITGKRRLKVPVPGRLIRGFGAFEELRARYAGGRPFVTKEWAEALMESTLLSSSKARRELGYTITPLRSALEATLHWLAMSSPLR
jgi:farnesol dehydrogenase